MYGSKSFALFSFLFGGEIYDEIMDECYQDGYLSFISMTLPNQKNYLWQFLCLGPDVFLRRTISRLELAATFTIASSHFGNCRVINVRRISILDPSRTQTSWQQNHTKKQDKGQT